MSRGIAYMDLGYGYDIVINDSKKKLTPASAVEGCSV